MTKKVIFEVEALDNRDAIAKQIQGGELVVELLTNGDLYLHSPKFGETSSHFERAQMLKLFFKNL